MEIKIRDVAHLYLGAKTTKGTLIGITATGNVQTLMAGKFYSGGLNEIQLLLREVSDITDNEKLYYKELTGNNWNYMEDWYAEALFKDMGKSIVWLWLLKQGFDLFELIPSKQALNIKPHQAV